MVILFRVYLYCDDIFSFKSSKIYVIDMTWKKIFNLFAYYGLNVYSEQKSTLIVKVASVVLYF